VLRFFAAALWGENLYHRKGRRHAKFAGYFPFYWDAKAGKLWLEIDKWNSEFLYVESLPAGIGINDIGLDQGQVGQAHVRSNASGHACC
jgi:hypothetical protein